MLKLALDEAGLLQSLNDEQIKSVPLDEKVVQKIENFCGVLSTRGAHNRDFQQAPAAPIPQSPLMPSQDLPDPELLRSVRELFGPSDDETEDLDSIREDELQTIEGLDYISDEDLLDSDSSHFDIDGPAGTGTQLPLQGGSGATKPPSGS